MLRNLYFWLVARRHVGEAAAFDTEAAEMAGILEHADFLGCSFRQAGGNTVYLSYDRLTAIAVGERVAADITARAALNAERSGPKPAFSGDELRRMLEEEPA